MQNLCTNLWSRLWSRLGRSYPPAGEENAAQFFGKALRQHFEIGGAKNCSLCAFLIKAFMSEDHELGHDFCTPNFNVFELRFLVGGLKVEIET